MDQDRASPGFHHWGQYGAVDTHDGCAATDSPFAFTRCLGGHADWDFRIHPARWGPRQSADDDHRIRGTHWWIDVYRKSDGSREAPGRTPWSPHDLQGTKLVQLHPAGNDGRKPHLLDRPADGEHGL